MPATRAALDAFGFGDANLSVEDFTDPGRFVRLGHPPLRIDILTAISGVTWAEVHAGRVVATLDGLAVPFIGRAEFLANKRAAARAEDLADIEALGESP